MLGWNILTAYDREEQQPLEDFFQAKGLKTKNEMLDDVGCPIGTNQPVLTVASRAHSLQQRSRMQIWRHPTKKS